MSFRAKRTIDHSKEGLRDSAANAFAFVHTYSSSFDGFSQEFDHVVSDHAIAVEAFRPLNQSGDRQALLGAGKREGEAERQTQFFDVLLLHEVR